MSGVTVAFESKAPHTTPWLSIEYDVEDGEPTDLLSDFAELGWKEYGYRLPALDGNQEIHLQPPAGSGLFTAWTPQEARKNMPPARRILRKHGFDRVPWNRLELADLL